MYTIQEYLDAFSLVTLTDGDCKTAKIPAFQGIVNMILNSDRLPDVPQKVVEDLNSESTWETIVNLMDDELREKIHGEFAPCSNGKFLDEYCQAHIDKFKEEFCA